MTGLAALACSLCLDCQEELLKPETLSSGRKRPRFESKKDIKQSDEKIWYGLPRKAKEPSAVGVGT